MIQIIAVILTFWCQCLGLYPLLHRFEADGEASRSDCTMKVSLEDPFFTALLHVGLNRKRWEERSWEGIKCIYKQALMQTLHFSLESKLILLHLKRITPVNVSMRYCVGKGPESKWCFLSFGGWLEGQILWITTGLLLCRHYWRIHFHHWSRRESSFY